MSRWQAAQVSLPELNQRYNGWSEEQKQKWEIARWVVWNEYRLSPYIKPADKPKSPTDIFKFEGETTPIDSVMPEDCHVSVEMALALEELYRDFKTRQVN